MKSIMPKVLNDIPYAIERFDGSEEHHVFFGTSNRKLSEEDGLVVYLTPEMHRGKYGVHFNKPFDEYLKKVGQLAWMSKNNSTVEQFIARYGRNYLD